MVTRTDVRWPTLAAIFSFTLLACAPPMGGEVESEMAAFDTDALISYSAPHGSSLAVGRSLGPGEMLVSPSGNAVLAMQSDGNLVLYGNNRALWHTSTFGNSGAHAVMQGDGNFVVYGPRGTALWSARTWDNPGARVHIQDDGNLVVYSSTKTPLFATSTRVWPSGMASPAEAHPGSKLVSPSGQYEADFQTDGNLVVYGPGGVVWSSGTGGQGADKLGIQGDGNVVIYRGSTPLWYTNTAGKGAAHFQMQDDGNLVLYTTSQDWAPIWATSWQTSSGPSSASRAIDFALSQVGKGYKLGAEGPSLFDCSGLTYAAWAAAGVQFGASRSAAQQYQSVGVSVAYAQRQPGDLLFWANNGTIAHVAIYLGNDQMVESTSGVGVRTHSVYNSPSWRLMDTVKRVQ